jgi:hypothetical protein
MSAKRSTRRSERVFAGLVRQTAAQPACAAEDEVLDLDQLAGRVVLPALDTSKTLRMKKFRAQLLHQWLVNQFEPCRAADIGGGKGLLSHLLRQSGWDTVVIDPVGQPLPDKYKDIRNGKREKIDPGEAVPNVEAPFEVDMAADFDLLLGMHAHGCNVKIIDAAARYGCGFVIFPCCVIGEPFFPRLGVHWIEALAAYALEQGCDLFPVRLNFKGQNIGLCHPGKARLCAPATG